MCSLLRILGIVLIIWSGFLLSRDFVLSGDASLWFVGSSAGLGVFALVSSWWPVARKRNPDQH